MLGDFAVTVVGLVALFMGGDWLIRAASRLAASLGIPTIIIGLTVIAVGTSAPELVVGLSAALAGVSDITIGNIVGSNIANIGLILAIAGLIKPLIFNASMVRRELPFMLIASLVVVLMALDGEIGRLEGGMLVVSYAAFTYYLIRRSEEPQVTPVSEEELIEAVESLRGNERKQTAREIMGVILSLAVLIIGAQLTVTGATNIARSIGISELVIGLTLVAVGTSLPEISTSILASLRGHADLAAGNAVGSNIANLLLVLGLVAMIHPVAVPDSINRFEFPIMMGFAVATILFVLNRRLSRWQSAILMLGYIVFLVVTVGYAG